MIHHWMAKKLFIKTTLPDCSLAKYENALNNNSWILINKCTYSEDTQMYMEVKEKMLEVILVKLLAIHNKLTENNLLIFVSTMHS